MPFTVTLRPFRTFRLYGSVAVLFNRAAATFAVLALAVLLALPMQAQGQGASETLIVALGDSLTAGYGLAPNQALPARLEARLRAEGLKVKVQNAGVSGDTSAGGLARLDWAMAENPRFVIVALGANDMLRGLDPKETRANLDRILGELKARGIRPMLVGMRAQRNLGPDYVAAFEKVYTDLAERHAVPLYPFMLEGVAMDPSLSLPDGMHPNARGVEIMAERIAPFVGRVVRGG